MNNKENCYNSDEFKKWMSEHPEVVNFDYYKKHFKEFKDSKLPPVNAENRFILFDPQLGTPRIFWIE